MELLQSNLEFLWRKTSCPYSLLLSLTYHVDQVMFFDSLSCFADLLLIFLVEKVSFMKVYQSTIRYVPTVDILVAEASILTEYALLCLSFYA